MVEISEWQQGEPSLRTDYSLASRTRSEFDWSQAPAPWNEIGPEFRRRCKEIVGGAAASRDFSSQAQ
jgi:hypothetical protein